jgi:cyclopropane fatty-acyl-phospholipid synthase-like methyltransferase
MGVHQAERAPDSASRVRSYYEKNTRLFLALGVGRRTLAIRRAVWAEGVRTLAQAVDYVNGLIAAEARKSAAPAEAARILDIGCGVGGSLFSLAAALGPSFHGVGVTLSPLQAHIARVQAGRRKLSDVCTFVDGDFSSLPGMGPFSLAFAIESYVHFQSPDSFFAAAARSLAHGGRLIVVDDFLAREHYAPRERSLVRAFEEGWILSSLGPSVSAARAAARHGFRLSENSDLSPHLLPAPSHSLLGRWTVQLMRALPVPSFYWKSTIGSLALSLCQREGLTEYRYLVFEKEPQAKPFN